ncbi:unnamed protein product [Arabis nemorensis]|uniref:Uncharacterized protein n=1 Tax=Arabis nemorensis TaxID=586526 RepID=A0A565C881_9BRAS|nr:unnamed protein product [Arabis nemorensis]
MTASLLSSRHRRREFRAEKEVQYGVNLQGKELLLLRGTLGDNKEPISDVRKQEILIPDDVVNGFFMLCEYISLELVKFLGINPDEETEEIGSGSISAIPRKCLADDHDDTALKELLSDMKESLERHGLKIWMYTPMVDDIIDCWLEERCGCSYNR